MEHVFAGIPVADLQAGLDWWERLLHRAPDMRPNEDEAVWHLTESSSVYVVRDGERAGNGLLTLFVDDLDAQLAGMAERGIAAGEVGTKPGVRVTTVVDPDGNQVQLGELQQARR
jgi:catechol 2,3-dioxygenase-like lactoylglutathione lyase family enzyme